MIARCIVVISLIGAATARADKFTHHAAGNPDVQITDRARPIAKRDTPAAPEVRADDVLRVAGLVEDIRDEQIAILKGLIASAPKDDVDERATLLFQLGEMYAKQLQFHRLKKIEDELAKRPTAAEHAKKAKAALMGAAETYKALTEDPALANFPRMDVALFYEAYTLQSAGYAKEARVAYDRLLKNYPRSRYVPEAHLAFAEAFWEANQLVDAEARYREVLKFPSSSVYTYAQYKLAWVDLNQRKFEQALELFFQVAQGTAKDPDRAVLHRAAVHDFVRAYAEIGRQDKALPAFQKLEAKAAFDMLAMLADLYGDQGKNDKAIATYRELMRKQPASPHVCEWQHSVARAMLTVGATEDKLHEIEELVRLYSAVGKRLPKAEAIDCRDSAAEMAGQLARAYHQEAAKTKNPELAAAARRLYKAYLGAFGDGPDAAETRYWAAELSWLVADLEREPRRASLRWEDAARAFTDAVERGKLDAKLVQISADAAMLAWMKALAVDPKVAGEAIDDETAYKVIPKPKALPEREQKLLAAYDTYLKLVKDPDDSERIDVLFHKGRLLRKFDHHQEAIAIFEDIIARHPAHETAEYSAELALDSYNRLQRYDDMLALAKKLPPKLLADHPTIQGRVTELGRQHDRKVAEELEKECTKSNDLAKCVACGSKYLEVYSADVDAKDADELLYDGGLCYEEGRSLSAAKSTYELLQKLFPKSQLTARSVARLGNIYATVAYYREAAGKLEEYAIKYAGEEDAYKALSDAVQFRKGIGDDDKAIADAKKFIELFGRKRPQLAATAFFSLIGIYEKQGDPDALAKHLRAYIAQYGKTGGADRLVIASAKLGETLWLAACPVKTVDGACVKDKATVARPRCGDKAKVELVAVPRDERKLRDASAAFAAAIAEYERAGASLTGDTRGALYYYAQARFLQAEREYERYLAMPIPSGLDFSKQKPAVAARSHQKFDAWFAKKRELGATLRKQYEPLINLGDGAVAIAAAARLGAVNQNFSTQLFRAEIPADVRSGAYAEEASDAYCSALEAVAEPLETDAVKSYQFCLDTSTRLGWFSQWSRQCERELGQLAPNEYPSTSELRHTPDSVATVLDVERPVKLTE